MKLLHHIAAILTLSFGQPIFAATFDFGSPFSVPATGYSTTVSGITVNITTPEGNKLGYYTFSSLGYGIGHSGCVFFVCSNGIQQNESLIVSFSEAVTVTGITFAAWDGPDTAKLVASNGNTITLDDDPTIGQVDSFNPSTLGQLTSLTITDTNFSGIFTLRGLQVEPVGSVPVPAAAWLFGSGLVGLAGATRRRIK